MKTMKKMFKSVLAGLVAVALVASAAGVASAQAFAPRDPNTKQALDINHVGAKTCRVNQGGAAKLCESGAGRIYELCAFGTAVTVGKGAMAFDSAVTSSASNFQMTFGISPIVFGTGATGVSSIADWSPKCWKPAVPVRFENGLGLLADSDSVSAIVTYRLDSGINP